MAEHALDELNWDQHGDLKAAPAEARTKGDGDSVCWICGGPVLKRHCKIICQRCGFMRDCSDP